jgi:hypothetical protein
MKRDETRHEIGYYIAFVTGALTPIQKAKRSQLWCCGAGTAPACSATRKQIPGNDSAAFQK